MTDNKNTSHRLKQIAAQAAIDYIKQHHEEPFVLGVGTGSTTLCFIELLPSIKHLIQGTVPSSSATEQALKNLGFPIFDSNGQDILVYVDGADEVNGLFQCIKGGGAALMREKILATQAKKFICIADESKKVQALGKFPVPIEVHPFARSYVARKLVLLGANPVYREKVVTDNGNIILDTYDLNLNKPIEIEHKIKQITGVVETGIFAERSADVLIIGTSKGPETTLSKRPF
jgi:ribose 5-phosphate isomerase A